ncbi:MAG TPA: pyridoxal kinase PdxY [Rectinemataceae bacterium]
MVKVLSVQSHVVFGHVGNRAAVFPLERMGIEVLPLNTVQLSTHTGYGQSRGMIFPASHIRELWSGLLASGTVSGCHAVLSGYLGSPETGQAILDMLSDLRKEDPSVLYFCDPVMGDRERGLYVRPEIPSFFVRAMSHATIVKPNQFEAEILSGMRIGSLAELKSACSAILSTGPRILLITSLEALDPPEDRIDSLLATEEGAWMLRTPRFGFDIEPHGAGDLVSAIFLGAYLKSRQPVPAFERCLCAVHEVLKATEARGGRELALIEAQEALVSEECPFAAERVW